MTDYEYREPHEPGLVEIAFYDRNVPPEENTTSLHAIAVRGTGKISPSSTITRCGQAITPLFNEHRTLDDAVNLLSGPGGCVACLEKL